MVKRAKRRHVKNKKSFSKKKLPSRKRGRKDDWRQSLAQVLKMVGVVAIIAIVAYLLITQLWLRRSDTLIPEDIAQQDQIDLNNFSKAELFDYRLYEIFKQSNLLENWIKRSGDKITVRIPVDIASVTLVHNVIVMSQNIGLQVLDSQENLLQREFLLDIGEKGKSIRTLILKQEAALKRHRGKIAIIVDDFGYVDAESIEKLLSVPQMITCAVIPGLAKSKAMYQLIQQYHKEPLIHMPMEAQDQKVEYSDYTIFASMADADITARVQRAIAEYPAARGMNNHMGSLVTSNSEAMRVILNELKRHGKFFVDSKTTSSSVVKSVAQRVKIPIASRDIFLERKRNDSKDYLRKKLVAISKIAETTGSAVAIGHPYNHTIDVLVEEIPKLDKAGFDFVGVSALVK